MRLNKELRQAIVDNALAASSVESETNALSKRSYELSERVRLDSLGGETVEKNMLAVEKEVELLLKRRGIPEHIVSNKIFERKNLVVADIPGGSVHFDFSGLISRKNAVPLPGHLYTQDRKLAGGRMSYDASHPYVLERNEIINAWSDVISKRYNIVNQARALVDSFNTVEQLVKYWPEAEALIPREKVSKPLPLSTNVADINLLIGLPK